MNQESKNGLTHSLVEVFPFFDAACPPQCGIFPSPFIFDFSIYAFYSSIEEIKDVESVINGERRLRSLFLYLPPSYHQNLLKRDYPLILMNDGQNLVRGFRTGLVSHLT